LLERLRDGVLVSDDDETTRLVRSRIADLEAATTAWGKLDGAVAEARLFPLTRFIGDVYAGALLTERAAGERATRQTDRTALAPGGTRCVTSLTRDPFAASKRRATRRSNDLTSWLTAHW
jgi:hypothetical protein